MGKVPVITDAGTAISESGAIITYLADKYAAGELAPRADDPNRGPYLKWMFFGAGVIEPAFGQKFFNLDLPAQQVGWGSFEAMQSVVTEAVGSRDWLVGDRFTAALYVGANLNFGVKFGILPQEGPIAEYAARLTARPAFQRASELEARFVAERERSASG